MPEMSFGRSIRYRRNRLGLSQNRLGELVGRSGAAVRSWERDSSTPTDPAVLQALSAVLGIEREVLFEKAGVGVPVSETSPTLEEVLGSLATEDVATVQQASFAVNTAPVSIDDLDEDDDGGEDPEYDDEDQGNEESMPETFSLPDEVSAAPAAPVVAPIAAISTTATSPTPAPVRTPPGFTTSQPRYLFTTPAPPLPELTYMEDESQRQLYRIRNLATLVIVVGLIVLFVWALGNGWEAFTNWWDDFVSTMQL